MDSVNGLFVQGAPDERASSQEIERQARLFAGKELLGMLPDLVPCALFVVNRHRQIVFANERFMELVPPEQRGGTLLGRRPGEALGCVHAFENRAGCGTTESCSVCGAVQAILTSQRGTTDVQECRITCGRNHDAMDLRVWTTPVMADGEPFSIVAALDISHEKRRQVLEHIFLHDIANVAYGLKWYTDVLQKGAADADESLDNICLLCSELIDEINGQRILIGAENGELAFTPGTVSTLTLIREAVELYRRHPVGLERHLRIDADAVDTRIVSDRTLLSRVLCNMIKNALEASRTGETVTAGCTVQDGQAEFWVHNPGCMPREVQLQIFQRSFSTKGPGRGLGTHSIRLLTERYLKGAVSFTSTREQGTTFHVRCPLSP